MLLFILWVVLAIGGWFAIVADSKKKGLSFGECHKRGAKNALGVSYLFLIGWLIWAFAGDDAEPEKPAEVQAVQNRAPSFDRDAILEAVKDEAHKKYTDTDGFDIHFDGYRFGADDATTLALEFKPDYILLAISFIADNRDVQEEERLLKIAQVITATITGTDRDLVSENRAGVLKGDFFVNGVKCGSVGPISGHSTLHFYREGQ